MVNGDAHSTFSWLVEGETQRQRGQRHKQHRQGHGDAAAEIIPPTDGDVLLRQHMQPQQRGQATNWRDLGPQIAADDVGINHGLFDRPCCRAAINRQGADQYAGHIIHNRREEGRQDTGAQRRGPEAALRQHVQHRGQIVR
ncbi:Uncharacterised protein [Klebsiella pneumoniae]|nr:Uncharacterised protein [Klebsiella pneumoniae]